MTETLTKQADQKTSLIDRSLIISPTAICKIISEGVSLHYRNQHMLSYAIYHCIILDDR
jgi:hypothetical protein